MRRVLPGRVAREPTRKRESGSFNRSIGGGIRGFGRVITAEQEAALADAIDRARRNKPSAVPERDVVARFNPNPIPGPPISTLASADRRMVNPSADVAVGPVAAEAYLSAASATTTLAATIPPTPAKIGSQIAGTFKDATGSPVQSHLVYAPNAGVWWLFTLSSAHDSTTDHTVLTYYSSGPDLTAATWTAAASSPHLANAGFATDAVFAGGRSLGVATLSIGGADYAHVFASTAFDGQVASNGHIRARLGANAIQWGMGQSRIARRRVAVAGSAQFRRARARVHHSSWGDVVGISTGGFIHHSSVTMDQEVDCNAARSSTADTAAAWTNGFGRNAVGASPPNTTAVIDKSMTFSHKSLAFAPLASDVMLAVYSNGAVLLTNLRFQRSGANRTWTNIASSRRRRRRLRDRRHRRRQRPGRWCRSVPPWSTRFDAMPPARGSTAPGTRLPRTPGPRSRPRRRRLARARHRRVAPASSARATAATCGCSRSPAMPPVRSSTRASMEPRGRRGRLWRARGPEPRCAGSFPGIRASPVGESA